MGRIVRRCIRLPGVLIRTTSGEQVDHEILTHEQRRRVDPGSSAIPPLDRRRKEHVLPHQVCGIQQRTQTADRRSQRPRRLHDELDGTLDLRADVRRVVEVRGAEQCLQHRSQVVAAVAEPLRQTRDVSLRGFVGTVRQVIHEESIQLETDEFTDDTLVEEDVDEVVAIPVTAPSEDRLRAWIVLGAPEDELIILERVPRQRPRAFLDVCFGVTVAFAEREQLHEFAGEVLIRLAPTALIVVQIPQHRRVMDDLVGQRLEVADGVGAKQLILPEHVIAVFDRAVPGREVAVQEQRHLFFERAGRLDQAFQPPALHLRHLTSVRRLAPLTLTPELLDDRLLTASSCGGKLLAFIRRRGTHDVRIERIGFHRRV